MYNHHNPSLVLPLMTEALKALGKDWQDVSYGNDCCASISIELHKDNPKKNVLIEIFFPNAEKQNDETEEFSQFWIKATSNHFENEMEDICFECITLQEAIENAQKFEATL